MNGYDAAKAQAEYAPKPSNSTGLDEGSIGRSLGSEDLKRMAAKHPPDAEWFDGECSPPFMLARDCCEGLPVVDDELSDAAVAEMRKAMAIGSACPKIAPMMLPVGDAGDYMNPLAVEVRNAVEEALNDAKLAMRKAVEKVNCKSTVDSSISADSANQSILYEADQITSCDRNKSYGPPRDNHSRTAALWSAYLGVPITYRQVCWMNVLQKASRDVHAEGRDNLVDGCGFLRNIEMADNDEGR